MLILDVHVMAAGVSPSSITATSGCPGLQAVNPLCQVASIGGTIASGGIDAVLNAIGQWVASGAEWLVSQIGDVLLASSSIDVSAGWFRTHYVEMLSIAAVVIVPLLIVSSIQAVYRQSASQLVRAFFVQLPLALLLGAVGIQMVALLVSATDELCTAVAGTSGTDVTSLLNGLTSGIAQATGNPLTATFVLLLVCLVVAMAAFVLWLELLVRSAAVYVAVLFLPLALATLVWPSVSHWCRRLVETLFALILSKFVIVATLSLAAGALSSTTAGSGSSAAGAAGSGGFGAVLAGGALLVLAAFVPFAILRIVPVIEAGAVAHLEGARRRGQAALTAVPMMAASHALTMARTARSSRQILDMAAAHAGGGGDSGGSAGRGGSGGGGGGAGPGGGSGLDTDAGAVPVDEVEKDMGPIVNGFYQGVPGSLEEEMRYHQTINDRPKGPKPWGTPPKRAGSVGAADLGGPEGDAGAPPTPAASTAAAAVAGWGSAAGSGPVAGSGGVMPSAAAPVTSSPPGPVMHDGSLPGTVTEPKNNGEWFLDGLPVMGHPEPNDRWYVMDRDELGGVVRYVRGTGPQ